MVSTPSGRSTESARDGSGLIIELASVPLGWGIHPADWAITATALKQIAGPGDEPAVQLRVLIEMDF